MDWYVVALTWIPNLADFLSSQVASASSPLSPPWRRRLRTFPMAFPTRGPTLPTSSASSSSPGDLSSFSGSLYIRSATSSPSRLSLHLSVDLLSSCVILVYFAAPLLMKASQGWCIAKAGGAGPLLSQGATKSGSQFGWAFTAAMMACLGNMATLITNATDFGEFLPSELRREFNPSYLSQLRAPTSLRQSCFLSSSLCRSLLPSSLSCSYSLPGVVSIR